eukprot:Amastigsp_a339483_8.p4 type:complete len:125 gc:universal Amastigsp_a339483_8:655-1029(+)
MSESQSPANSRDGSVQCVAAETFSASAISSAAPSSSSRYTHTEREYGAWGADAACATNAGSFSDGIVIDATFAESRAFTPSRPVCARPQSALKESQGRPLSASTVAWRTSSWRAVECACKHTST